MNHSLYYVLVFVAGMAAFGLTHCGVHWSSCRSLCHSAQMDYYSVDGMEGCICAERLEDPPEAKIRRAPVMETKDREWIPGGR